MSEKYDVIMDGRDIGTVVLKDSKFKFFLTASAEERANRRYKELTERGLEVNYDEILSEIIRRDTIDSTREVDPLRKEKKMSQQELASMVGVSYRTIRSWEVEGRFPKQNVLYQKLADALQCDVSYLMSENEAFITEASEQFGNRGARQAQQILEQAAAMFAGGSLTDEDKIAFMDEIQSLYLDSKRRAKKFTPKKYLKNQEEK